MADLIAKNPEDALSLVMENGVGRAVSRDGSTEFRSALVFNGPVSDAALRHHCGALLHARYIDEPLAPDEMATVTHRDTIPVGTVPNVPIIKMMKSIHAQMLLDHGKLRLGSIDLFRRSEHTEVGDETEGRCILAAYDGRQTHIRDITGGLNDAVFCCFAGKPDRGVIDKFDYDSAVEIVDVEGFAKAIAAELGSTRWDYASCVYVRDRVLFGEVPGPLDVQDVMGGPFGEMLGVARAFLKPSRFQHQSEFRIIWTGAVAAPYMDITCPALRDFCRPVDISPSI